jgi:lipopolysaccharide/colanic/teichoic acid biosynthesis glycosyltransferase
VKRVFDVIGSVLLLLTLWPLLAAIAVGVKLASPGPALFRQTRVGRNGEQFTLFKFRSMHCWPTDTLATSAEDPRVFPFGRWLREYHLDELPQIWNVLRGHMSLVGPRPTIPEHVAAYTERQRRRLSVRPGITGLAQVSGNNALEWPRRIEVDLEYVARASTRTDLVILWRTVGTVLRRIGVYGPDGHVR